MKALHSGQYRLAPLTVLVDPDRIRFLVDPPPLTADLATFPDNVLYIYLKQLEEADVILLNKVDRLGAERRLELENALRRQFSRTHVMSISAKAGTGIDAWLDFVIGGDAVGRTVTDVDYDVYAEGEAALGWLNASYSLQADPEANWQAYCLRLMTALRDEFLARSAEVAHLKVHLKAGSNSLIGNLTSSSGEPSWGGHIDGVSPTARLLINARVHIAPETLRAVVERCVDDATGAGIRIDTEELRCFALSRPQPTHRYASVV